MGFFLGIFLCLGVTFITICCIVYWEKKRRCSKGAQVPTIVIDKPPPYNDVVEKNDEREHPQDHFHCFSSEFKDLPSYLEAVALEKRQNENKLRDSGCIINV